jgi:hypothetical protein
MEIYKLLQKKPITKLSNTFSNLAIPLFTSMEPEPPKITKSVIRGQERKFTPVRSNLNRIIIPAHYVTT